MSKVEQIFDAVGNGDFESFRSLLHADPNLINSCNQYGQSPFWVAAYHGRIDFMRYALETEPISRVVNYDMRDRRGRDPLHVAKFFENNEMIELLEIRHRAAYDEAAKPGPGDF